MRACLRFSFPVVMSFLFAACGATTFKENNRSNKSPAETELTAAQEECLKLYKGDPTPGKNPCLGDEPNPFPNTPGQNPGQTPGQFPGKHPGPTPCDNDCESDCGIDFDFGFDFGFGCGGKCDDACGDPCGGFDCNDPCQDDCGDAYIPIDQNPTPFPIQQPIIDDKCGKDGFLCEGPGQHPGQWPGQTISGHQYDRGDIEGCMDAFRRSGYDTKGMWGVDVRTIKNVSVLSSDVVEDFGRGHNIVVIKSVNVLGAVDYRLMNPNALYCIRSTSVLEDVRITSCHSRNVVFGKEVNVLSTVASRVVDCR